LLDGPGNETCFRAQKPENAFNELLAQDSGLPVENQLIEQASTATLHPKFLSAHE